MAFHPTTTAATHTEPTGLCLHPQLAPLTLYTSACTDCGARTVAVDPDVAAAAIGPRRVGGHYQPRNGLAYTVLDIRDQDFDLPWSVTIRTATGAVVRSASVWDPADRILSQP